MQITSRSDSANSSCFELLSPPFYIARFVSYILSRPIRLSAQDHIFASDVKPADQPTSFIASRPVEFAFSFGHVGLAARALSISSSIFFSSESSYCSVIWSGHSRFPADVRTCFYERSPRFLRKFFLFLFECENPLICVRAPRSCACFFLCLLGFV